ncbi:MAG: hypothetical protein EXR81_06340 [Gammaproteobacteria bacterium]|nr:hypothetical protein [Gammaproteobacteria bacterium]
MFFYKKIRHKLVAWLIVNNKPLNADLFDFTRLKDEVEICDVLLVEGRSRVAQIIKVLSQSPWSHSVLNIGHLENIKMPEIRTFVEKFVQPEDRDKHLILEALFDQGIVLKPIDKYRGEHLRICRPTGLFPGDAQKVLTSSLKNLGKQYNTRQIFDLLRFLLPVTILPRRWLSTLFEYQEGSRTEEICSSMLVDAFNTVGFPVRPIIKMMPDNQIELIRRNPLLYTPSDFDYSPYFNIIKYPIYGSAGKGYYHDLNWNREGKMANSDTDIFTYKSVPRNAPT